MQRSQASRLRRICTKFQVGIHSSCVVYGGLDESGLLQPNQIFLQLTQKEKGRKMVVQGRCLATRNPTYVAEDIRIVTAVDIPALHYIQDVVLFPKCGDRSLPDRCWKIRS